MALVKVLSHIWHWKMGLVASFCFLLVELEIIDWGSTVLEVGSMLLLGGI